MGYDAVTGTHSLQEYWVSKASANQRRGRAGRTGPGVCFRLYEREAFDEFLDFAIPEIKRVQIESTALQIKCMGLGDPRMFPFIEPPPEGNLEHSMQVPHAFRFGALPHLSFPLLPSCIRHASVLRGLLHHARCLPPPR